MVDYLASFVWMFAAPYGACAYGSSNYNNGVCGASESLVNTGTMVVGAATLGCLLIFVTLLVRFARRKKQAHYRRVR